MVFHIYSNHADCGGNLNNNGIFGDDMEISIRFLSDPSEWIPFSLIQINRQRVTSTRHGYDIPYIYKLDYLHNIDVAQGHITVCNFSLTDSIQVRWLVTSHTCCKDRAPTDVWSLDDVEITLITECDNYTLLADSFDSDELK